MRLAVGTSLAIIAMKSLSGFYKYLDVLHAMEVSVDWWTVALFVWIGVLGSFVGGALSRQMNQVRLQRAFAVFLVIMGTLVLIKESPAVFSQWQRRPHVAATPLIGSADRPATLSTAPQRENGISERVEFAEHDHSSMEEQHDETVSGRSRDQRRRESCRQVHPAKAPWSLPSASQG